MRALLAGAGALCGLHPGARGTVLASFSRACYLDLTGALVLEDPDAHPAGLVALVGRDAHPGPVHLVLDGPVPTLTPGSPVIVGDGELLVGQRSVDLRAVQPWTGALPAPALVHAAAPLLSDVLEEAAAGSPLSAAAGSPLSAMGARASEGLERLRAGDPDRAAALLGGLGPGLTPAGDDVLAGAMVALRALCGPNVQPALARAAGAVRTCRISLAFLVLAARGQTLAPVHDLLVAAVKGDAERAAAAARALAAVGASSGADFALGLRAILIGHSTARRSIA